MTSSIYPLPVNLATPPVAIGADLLTQDFEISDAMVSPGGGGILRLWFAFVFNTSPGKIVVINNNVDKGFVNADNDGQIFDNGIYRFDIDVESGDKINLQLRASSPASATQVTGIHYIRGHQIQFGA